MSGRLIAVAAALVMWCAMFGAGGTVSAAAPDLYVFGRGLDNVIWYRGHDANGWGPWTSIGGVASERPAAVTYPDGRVAVFVRGQDSALWVNESADGAHWSGWRSLGGVVTGASVVARNRAGWPPGVFDVYASVIGNDERLYVKRFASDTGMWSGWQGPRNGVHWGHLSARPWGNAARVFGVGPGGRIVATDVSVEGMPDDAMILLGEVVSADLAVVQGFVAGQARSGEALQTSDGSSLTSWGGLLTSGPVAGPSGDDLLLARGTDGAVWSVGCCGQGWHSLRGYTLEVPSFGQAPSGGVLAARGRDVSVWMREVATGTTTFGPWEPLGGILKEAPVVLGAFGS